MQYIICSRVPSFPYHHIIVVEQRNWDDNFTALQASLATQPYDSEHTTKLI